MPTPRNAGALYSPQAKLNYIDIKKSVFGVVSLSKDIKLTERQSDVLKLILNGYNQTKTARILKINQTAVHKALFGNLVYSGEYKGRRHGGIFAKLKKASCKNDMVYECWKHLKENDMFK